MRATNLEAKWIEQGRALLAGAGASNELPQFAISMLAYFYGTNSAQVRSYEQAANNHLKNKFLSQMSILARGAISSTIRELENGLVTNLRTSIQGEILGDMVGLAREALSADTPETANVAAVLAAAAFEDCLRRLAAEKAGVQDRPKLESVVGALKDADLIRGGNISLANTLLKFRNDSLHADWQKVQQAQVESCLALTESLLREHFS
jgi:hypothetical protein